MNAKKARAARRQAPPPVHSAAASAQWWRSWKGPAVAAAVVAVVAASFVLPSVLSGSASGSPHAGMAMGGLGVGEGLPVGTTLPGFDEKDVQTGATISSKTVAGKKTLLFFSEGVMCQACFQQIKDIEGIGAQLHRRGIELISVTPDSTDDLRRAMAQYDIRSTMISDSNRNMSTAFNTLGKGMHGNTPGHAFVLIENGKLAWYHDYWLPPTNAMYVKPAKILADIPASA